MRHIIAKPKYRIDKNLTTFVFIDKAYQPYMTSIINNSWT